MLFRPVTGLKIPVSTIYHYRFPTSYTPPAGYRVLGNRNAYRLCHDECNMHTECHMHVSPARRTEEGTSSTVRNVKSWRPVGEYAWQLREQKALGRDEGVTSW